MKAKTLRPIFDRQSDLPRKAALGLTYEMGWLIGACTRLGDMRYLPLLLTARVLSARYDSIEQAAYEMWVHPNGLRGILDGAEGLGCPAS